MKAFACSKLLAGINPAHHLNNIISAIKTGGGEALFVAGGLFCDHLFNDELYYSLYNAFSALPDTGIFVCPGSDDPYMPDSPYLTRQWPANVHIFNDRLKAFELASRQPDEPPVRVYGIASVRHNPDICAFIPQKVPRTDRSFLNILLLGNLPEKDCGETISAVLKDGTFDALIYGMNRYCTDMQGAVAVPEAVVLDTTPVHEDCIIPFDTDKKATILSGTIGRGCVSFQTEVI